LHYLSIKTFIIDLSHTTSRFDAEVISDVSY
jgi:hypothetical protein